RRDAMGWTDKEGGLWLFGGYGYGASSGPSGNLNDLWRFFNGNWEFVGGSDTINVPANYTGSDQTPGGIQSSHVWQFPNGKVWLFGGVITGYTVANDLWEWEPTSSRQWRWLSGEK